MVIGYYGGHVSGHAIPLLFHWGTPYSGEMKKTLLRSLSIYANESIDEEDPAFSIVPLMEMHPVICDSLNSVAKEGTTCLNYIAIYIDY